MAFEPANFTDSNLNKNFSKLDKLFTKFKDFLTEDSLIFIMTDNEYNLFKITESMIAELLVSLNFQNNVIEIEFFNASTLCYIRLNSIEAINDFKSKVNSFNNFNLIYLDELLEKQKILMIKITGLTISFIKEHLHNYLKKYGEIINISYTKKEIIKNCYYESTPAFVIFKKHAMCTNDQIPYQMEINNRKRGYLFIRERDPICYLCKEVGHLATTCDKFWCVTCFNLVNKNSHFCKTSASKNNFHFSKGIEKQTTNSNSPIQSDDMSDCQSSSQVKSAKSDEEEGGTTIDIKNANLNNYKLTGDSLKEKLKETSTYIQSLSISDRKKHFEGILGKDTYSSLSSVLADKECTSNLKLVNEPKHGLQNKHSQEVNCKKKKKKK